MSANGVDGNGHFADSRQPGSESVSSPISRKGKQRAIIDSDPETSHHASTTAIETAGSEGYEQLVSYHEQLQRVLGESKESPLHANGNARPLRRSEMTKETLSESDSTPSTPSRNAPPAQSLSSSIASSLGFGHPPRRPALHPQISRLRSSQSPSVLRSASGASSNVLPGWRSFSPSSSQIDLLSRRSSASNLPESQTPPLSVLTSSSATSQNNVAPERSPVKWTTLKRLSARVQTIKLPLAATPAGTNAPATGRPVCLAASGIICVGTENGWTQVFDYNQTLRCTCGSEATATEMGAVSALAISQDNSFVAIGHVTGAIYLYNLANSAQPSRTVLPVSIEQVNDGRAEGHIQGSAITMISFVGGRHTTVLSADDRGMAFAHSLGQILGLASTDVARILGRYPNEGRSKAGRMSPIWDMAALPLGTTAHPADSHALVALITPIKLVVVGLRPKPRTWWRGKPAHGKIRKPQCGALSWQPNVVGQAEDPLLAYSWDDDVVVLEVSPSVGNKGLVVEEVMVAQVGESVAGLHWLTPRTLLLVMQTHLQIFDVPTRQRTGRAPFETADLAGLQDMQPVSPLLGPAALSTLHVRNLRVYKAKIFALLRAEVRVGTVLSWADRILALVSTENFIEAIALATSFYKGEAHASSLGLPEDDEARHSIVSPKLNEMLSACVDYAFSDKRMRNGTPAAGIDRTSLFQGLVDVAIRACLALDAMMFLWDEIFERFLENGIERLFLERLDPFMLSGQMRSAPTQVLQRLIAMHEERNEMEIAEQIIWHVDPLHLDLNQVLQLCHKWRLYDALAYVQSRALKDFVAPFVQFLQLMRRIMQDRSAPPNAIDDDGAVFIDDYIGDAYKLYVYLSTTLLGLSYPSNEPLPPTDADQARASLYEFLFSGRSLAWPNEGGRVVLTVDQDGAAEPTYPYLRLILRFDAEAALDALDAAFEDSYLDEGASVDRQLMINVLLEVMGPASNDFTDADKTFLNIFVARNFAKYQLMQFVLLPSSTSHRVLIGLTEDTNPSTIEDRQLAAEYLLSVYQPHDQAEMLERFEHAHFFRILRSIYRSDRRWAALTAVYLRDADLEHDIFNNLRDVLAHAEADGDGRETLQNVLKSVVHLASIDAAATAAIVERFDGSAHDEVVYALRSSRPRQYAYLRFLLDPDTGRTDSQLSAEIKHSYVDLLCEYDPGAVVRFLEQRDAVDQEAIAICERHEVFDAVIWALDRLRGSEVALERYEHVIETQGDLLRYSMLQGEDLDAHVLAQVASVSHMACDLAAHSSAAEQAERAWVRILRTLVDFSRIAPGPQTAPLLTDALAQLVSSDVGQGRSRISLSGLARRLLDSGRESSGTFGTLRPLINGLLTAHRSETAVLIAARDLAERDRFDALSDYAAARAQGWSSLVQPSEAICEACGEPAWDRVLFRPTLSGTSLPPYAAADDLQETLDEHHDLHIEQLALGSPDRTRSTVSMVKRPSLKGKEPIEPYEARQHADAAANAARKAAWKLASSVILRKDGKVFHRGCFEAINEETAAADRSRNGLPDEASAATQSDHDVDDDEYNDASRSHAVSMR